LPSLLLVVDAVSARRPRLCVPVSSTNSADPCSSNQMRREEHLVACLWSGSEQRIESRPRTPSLSPSKLGRHWQEQENALIFTKKHRYGNDTRARCYLLSAER